MSALGQKQTLAPQKSCPLYPRKRTCAAQLGMSALGHKRTYVIAVVIFAKRHRSTLGNTEQSFATFVSLT